jgi:hypothetical protein
MHAGWQKFETGDELKCSVLNWLHSKNRPWYAIVISTGMLGKYCNVFAY